MYGYGYYSMFDPTMILVLIWCISVIRGICEGKKAPTRGFQ